MIERCVNKKVLLHERKMHTARHVASAPEEEGGGCTYLGWIEMGTYLGVLLTPTLTWQGAVVPTMDEVPTYLPPS